MGRTIIGLLVVFVVLSACAGSTTTEVDTADYEDRYFEMLVFGSSPDEGTQIFTVYMSREQNLKAECMRAQGFEYTPLPVDQVFDAGVVDLTTREGRAENGYGISTLPALPSVVEINDPNIDYYETLDVATQDAYDESSDNCDRASQSDVEAQLGIPQAVVLAERVRAAMEVAPTVVAANNAWAACMADAGFQAATEDDLITQLGLEYGQLDPDGAEAKAFQTRERQAATVSWDCGDDLRTARRAVADSLRSAATPGGTSGASSG